MKNFRDVEMLSSYLDGQLSPSDSARLESRISSDLELASVLNDLRATRNILRKLPARKAPRNFTLTRKMVGLKPPLPRSYSAFRFSTAFATILLMLTFAANVLLPNVSLGAAAPMAAQEAYGVGGGPQMLGAPAATEAPAALAPMMAIQSTATELPANSQDLARVVETPTAEAQSFKALPPDPELQNQPQGQSDAPVPLMWQIVLLVIILLGALIMFMLHQSAIHKWK